MEEIKVNYLGRMVSKKNFRVFVYDKNGQQKLVESWSDFRVETSSGNWFPEPQNEVSDEKKIKTKRGRDGADSKAVY